VPNTLMHKRARIILEMPTATAMYFDGYEIRILYLSPA